MKKMMDLKWEDNSIIPHMTELQVEVMTNRLTDKRNKEKSEMSFFPFLRIYQT